ncbi:MAG: hypothetical protein QG654_368 [Patescibacteria group bacterium]|nr:hypothetical protein [Patescibacteria group bacterium]
MEQDEQITPKIRIGVVYDGYYFSRISYYYFSEHPIKRHLEIKGLNTFIKEKVAQKIGVDARNCYIADSQYFSGRLDTSELSASFRFEGERMQDEMLRRNSVNPNYLPIEDFKEKGVDVLLATTSLDMVIDLHLDVMVLVTGDGDFKTLPQTLRKRGCETMLLCWDFDSAPKADGSPSQTRTSRDLLLNADDPYEMHSIIQNGLRNNNELILSLFGKTKGRVELGQITSLHKREGRVSVKGKVLWFYKDDPRLGVDFNTLKEGQWVKLQKEKDGVRETAFNLESFSQ